MTEFTSTIGKVGRAASDAPAADKRAAEAAASIPQAIQPGLDPVEDLGPPLPPIEGQHELQHQEEKKPMPLPDLKSLIELGRIRDSIMIGGLKFEMETLSDDAQREIFKRMSDDDGAAGADSFVRLRRLTVALAMVGLNGQAFEDLMPGSENAIDRKIAIIARMQDSIVEKLFDFYNGLLERSDNEVTAPQVKN